MDKQTIEQVTKLIQDRNMVESKLHRLHTHRVFQIPEMYQNIIDRDKLYQIQREANDKVENELKAEIGQIDKALEAL